MSKIITEIRHSLYGAKGKSERKTVINNADLISDDSMSHEAYPDDHFSLIIEFLSKDILFNKNGSGEFLFTVFSDYERFSHHQISNIFDTLSKNYHRYKNLKLCWVVCDFIARKYDKKLAMRFFEENLENSSKEQIDGIKLGLDIVFQKSNNNKNLKDFINSILLRRGGESD